jgi:alkylhydroperoxidase family enzyme
VPLLAVMLEKLHSALQTDRILSNRLLELVRLRIAFWNQCRACMAARELPTLADGLTEKLVCSLERPQEAQDLTRAERVAIAYADLMATDHLSIDDETYDALRECFTEEEITELAINVAWWVGFGRLAATLNLYDNDDFQVTGQRVTAWSHMS